MSNTQPVHIKSGNNYSGYNFISPTNIVIASPYKVQISLTSTSPFSIRYPESGTDDMINGDMEVYKWTRSDNSVDVSANIETYDGYFEMTGTTTGAVDLVLHFMTPTSAT